MEQETILIIGACGQIGTELTTALRNIYGEDRVVASDINTPKDEILNGPFEKLDIMNADQFHAILDKYKITQIYHLAAVLSAKGEQNPAFAWKLNMESLMLVLEAARDRKLHKIYWPSSIAVFGPTTPMDHTPQNCVMDPNTVYGISKLAGERWCEYFFQKYGVDVRSIRYPGLIGYKALPGGGTTDYAVDIFHKAINDEAFECFLKEDTKLPMLYMPDAIRATIELMEAPAEKIKIRSAYNLGGMSFSPAEIAAEIEKQHGPLAIKYAPDFRQSIADSWPNSIDDSQASKDWGWKMEYDLPAMTKDILENLPQVIQAL